MFSSKNGKLIGLILLLITWGLSSAIQAQNCSQPSNLVSTLPSGNVVILNWSSVAGATNYTVQYRLSNSGVWLNGGTVTTTSQAIPNLLSSSVYSWRVKANCSVYSSVAVFNTGGNTGGNTACSQPSNLNYSGLSATSGTVTWSQIDGSFFYTVQYRPYNAGAWITAGSVSGLNMNLTNLLSGTQYGWRVKSSCSTYSSVALFNSSSTVGNTCSSPSNTSVLASSNNSANITWEPVSGAANYTVQYKTQVAASYITFGTITGNLATISGLLPGTQYVWRVKANCSPYGSDVQFTTTGTSNSGGGNTCSAPSNTNTVTISNTSASVNWESVIGAIGYTVQYKQQSATTYSTLGNVNVNQATISGLLPGTQYVWRVKANCSPYGSDVQFTTTGTNSGGGTTCSAPSNTNTTAIFPTSAQISWEPQSGASSYSVQYRRESGTSTFTTLGTITGTTATISGLTSGVQYVWRVKANCSPFGSLVQFITPLTNFKLPTTFSVFPVPAAEFVIIKSGMEKSSYEISNLIGKVVKKGELVYGDNNVIVSDVENGIYFLRVNLNDGGSETLRISIKH